MALQEAIGDIKQRIEEGRNIWISGRNSEGLYQYIKRNYQANFVELGKDEASIPETADKDALVVVRTSDLDRVNALGDSHTLVVIDPKDQILPNYDRFYGMSASHYVEGERKVDLDIAISHSMAELYLQTFGAYQDHEDQPFFVTAELVDYSRSRVILEGLLQSAIMKFPNRDHGQKPVILASREITGVKEPVRMYELAETLAGKLGMEPVKIEKTTDKDGSWMKDYVIRSNLEDRSVIVLDDVVKTGQTVENLALAVLQAKGKLLQTVVCMNRSGKHMSNVYPLTTEERFNELKKTRGTSPEEFTGHPDSEEGSEQQYEEIIQIFKTI